MTKDEIAQGVAARGPFRVVRYNHNHGRHGWFSSAPWNDLGTMPHEAIGRTLGRDLKAGKVGIGHAVRRHSDADHRGDYARAKPDIATTLASPLFMGLPKRVGGHINAFRKRWPLDRWCR